MSLTNGTSISAGTLTVGGVEGPGNYGIGTSANPSGMLAVNGSSLTVSGVEIGDTDVVVANPTAGTVILTNGSELNSSGLMFVGASSNRAEGAPTTGILDVFSGSTVNMPYNTESMVIGTDGSTGTVRVSGNNSALYFNQMYVGTDGIYAGAGTLQVDNNAVVSATDGLMVGKGGTLNVLSGGTLTIGNTNLTSAGAVNITGGTLNLFNSLVVDPSFALPNTSTITGTGTFYGNLISDGTIEPTDGRFGDLFTPGPLAVEGNYTQNSDAELVMVLDGRPSDPNYGSLFITGSASFNGGLDVTLFDGFVPAIGKQFQILSFASESGTFSSIQLPSLPGGESWDTSELYTSGTIIVVPEPASGMLILIGASALGLRRRRGSATQFRSTLNG